MKDLLRLHYFITGNYGLSIQKLGNLHLGDDTLSHGGLLELGEGDQVWVRIEGRGTLVGDRDRVTGFSGFLLDIL